MVNTIYVNCCKVVVSRQSPLLGILEYHGRISVMIYIVVSPFSDGLNEASNCPEVNMLHKRCFSNDRSKTILVIITEWCVRKVVYMCKQARLVIGVQNI
jgi:hypothetical protein